MSEPITEITIVGGGTAGWLAAMLLQTMVQDPKKPGRPIDITLVESPQCGNRRGGRGHGPRHAAIAAPGGPVGEGFLQALQCLLQAWCDVQWLEYRRQGQADQFHESVSARAHYQRCGFWILHAALRCRGARLRPGLFAGGGSLSPLQRSARAWRKTLRCLRWLCLSSSMPAPLPA